MHISCVRVMALENKSAFEIKRLILPVLVFVSNVAVSFLTRPFISESRCFCPANALDNAIPFVPGFIYIYVLAFLQWAVCVIAVMIIDRRVSDRYCTGIIIGNLISGIIFLAVPMVMSIRPEYSGGGLTGFLVQFIFAADDPPMNIFPSIHCLFSWGCMRMVFAVSGVNKAIKISNAVFSVLVFLSVLFVKQHLLYDVLAGIIVFETGLFTAGKIFPRNKSKVECKEEQS